MTIEIQIKDGQVVGKIREMEQAIDRLGSTSKRTGTSVKSLGGFLRGFTTSYAAYRGFRLFFETGVSIETELLKVRAVTNATEGEFQSLQATVLKLGRTTAFTASQVAQLQFELGKLGFSASEITRASEGVLLLAQATQTDLARAAEIAGMQIRAFSLDAGESGRVADVLTQSVTRSALTMERFAESAKYVAPIAAQLGVSIEETSALLAALADRGIHGSLAGVALRHMFLRLAAPTARASQEMKGFSLTTHELPEIFEELRTGGYSAIQMQKMFGLRVVSSALVLKGLGANLQNYIDLMTESEGRTKSISDLMMSQWYGAIKMLKSALEGLAQSIFATASQGKNLIEILTEATLKTRQWYIAATSSSGINVGHTLDAATFGALFGGAVAGVPGAVGGAGIGALIGAIQPTEEGRQIAESTLAMEKLVETGNKGQQAVFKWSQLLDRYRKYLAATKRESIPGVANWMLEGEGIGDEKRLKMFEKSLQHYYALNAETIELFDELFIPALSGKGYEQIPLPIVNLVERPDLWAQTEAEISNATQKIAEEINKSLAKDMKDSINKETAQKNKTYEEWLKSFIASGLPGDPTEMAKITLRDEFKGYEKVLMESLLGGGDLRSSFRELGYAKDMPQDVLDSLIKSVESYGEAMQFGIKFTQQFGQALGSFLVDPTSLKQGLKSILMVVLEFLEKLVLADMAAVGLRAILGDFSAMAKIFGVIAAFETAKGAILAFKSGGIASEVFNGRIGRSGLITGPGTGTSDSILARFSNGEAILNAQAVNALGVSRINYLNSYGNLPGYAMGGMNRITNETFTGNITMNFSGRDYNPFEVFRTTKNYLRKRKRDR